MRILKNSSAWRTLLGLACIFFTVPGNSTELLIPPQVPVPKSYFGLHIHRASIDKWPAVSFGSWRLHDAYVGWFSLQPTPTQWRLQLLDRYVNLAEAANVELLLPLAFPPRWASAKPDLKGPYQLGSSAPPKTLLYWRDYVRKIAEHYKGRINQYELWNEASEPGFFSGTQEDLLKLAREAYKVLKSVDQNNRLVSPSAVGVGGHFRWLEAYLKRGAEYADIINYHFYVPEHPPEMMVPRIHHVQEILRQLGLQDKPLWNTETGWRIENGDGTPEVAAHADPRWLKLTPEQGAAFVGRALILGWAAGLERFYWYAWDNQNMGLVEPSDASLKPAGIAYQTIARWLTGNILRQCTSKRGLLWECTLELNSGGEARVVWSTSGGREYCWQPNGTDALVQHLDGSSSALDTSCLVADQMPVMIVPRATGTSPTQRGINDK